MDGTTRVTLVSVLHPVQHACEEINNQVWLAKRAAEAPDLAEVEEILATVQTEAARAATLIRKLAES